MDQIVLTGVLCTIPAMASRAHSHALLRFRADLWRVPLAMWLSMGGPDDARVILGALLGTVSTVLALIFSVALLVLSMATTQFGPRILYRFVRDGVTQVTIGFFLASFVHALLAFVVTRQEADYQFVPELTLIGS